MLKPKNDSSFLAGSLTLSNLHTLLIEDVLELTQVRRHTGIGLRRSGQWLCDESINFLIRNIEPTEFIFGTLRVAGTPHMHTHEQINAIDLCQKMLQ